MAKSMQIKSNQDVREYKEVVYFGMTLRQLIFSALAGAAALGVYLLCNRRMSMEAVSWLWRGGGCAFWGLWLRALAWYAL